MGKKKIPGQLKQMVNMTVKNYLNAKESLQRMIEMNDSIKGRCGDYVFQKSNGAQQFKLYEPHKYRNEVNTPLRRRARMILKLAVEDPVPSKNEKMRHLMRTYPYYLEKGLPIKLRLTNFYFLNLPEGSIINIYKKSGRELNPETDQLYATVEYFPKKTVGFSYTDDKEECYYAVSDKTKEKSNLLHFIWN